VPTQQVSLEMPTQQVCNLIKNRFSQDNNNRRNKQSFQKIARFYLFHVEVCAALLENPIIAIDTFFSQNDVL
ncbi:MAG: hypothetical protein ACI8RD_007988, partial [Bacillariaceae sp.]|jgi:hypothetical protein